MPRQTPASTGAAVSKRRTAQSTGFGPTVGVLLVAVLAATFAGHSGARSATFEAISVDPATAMAVVNTVPYHQNVVLDCQAKSCIIGFEPIEAKERLHIESVACNVTTSSDAEMVYAGLLTGNYGFDVFAPRLISKGAQVKRFSFNHETKFIVKGDRDFWIRLVADRDEGILGAYCKIAGVLDTLE